MLYVADHMRAADREEILPLRFDKSPENLAATVMSNTEYVWLAAREAPIAVFGMFNIRPKAWAAFAFATDEFPKVAGEITKFLRRKVCPHLFDDLRAQRVEAWSHPDHQQAHKWLKLLGASGTPDPEYGPNGETYIHFVMRRSDWQLSEEKRAPTLFSYGRNPNLASSAPT